MAFPGCRPNALSPITFYFIMQVSAAEPLLLLAGFVMEKSWPFKRRIEIESERSGEGDGGCDVSQF